MNKAVLRKSEDERLRVKVKILIYTLVCTLVFEGIIRKILPSAFGLFIFFLKDILCIVSLLLLNKLKVRTNISSFRLLKIWKVLPILFIPLLINTFFKDPILPFFGMKQYLLYLNIAILVPLAFPPNKFKEFRRFIVFVTFLIIPTTLIAVLQNSLPPTHWLNLSVGGDSLEGFAAAGYLRVSSTFSFTGQYSWFLNIMCALLIFRICMPVKPQNVFLHKINPYILVGLSVLLMIGAFVTGGRTAVLGCGACLFLGFIFALIKAPERILTKGIMVAFGLVLCLGALRVIKPEFFAAYDQRSSGTEERSHSEEVEDRVVGDFFGWTTWLFKESSIELLFGNGLGVMSNGADKLSSYANSVRMVLWTETDLSTVVWEGGMYLLFLWYGLRLWVIIVVFRIWRNVKLKAWGISLSFLLAYIIIIGLYGTMSAQPPLAIWWWLCVGVFFAVDNFYKNINKKSNNLRMLDHQ